ncbi:hypothetical protein NOF55_10820 [Rhizobiaceae bacterium BDR2-2]|uniref:Uncharacterized protein n=1 Tax=Ectorhizobium quercum TaxID=2965071 RepID=A0AAE3N014_9HYPH|nr:hypothetical protein [Ectorhizobium quercum]MCX8997596.1 hypothetical protein [Ectorhizobium quercum]
MPDMISTGRALTRLAVIGVLAVLPLSGCKTLSFAGKTAEADLASASDDTKAASSAKTGSGTAYVDPYVATNGENPEATAEARTLPGSEEPAANIAGLATQPTGVRASQSSIFSTGIASDPATAPRGEDGALLPAAAYSPAPGINATLYSVYGTGSVPTGAPQPPLD